MRISIGLSGEGIRCIAAAAAALSAGLALGDGPPRRDQVVMVVFDANLHPDDERIQGLIREANGRVHWRARSRPTVMEVHVPPGRAPEVVAAWRTSELVRRVGPAVNFELQRAPPNDTNFGLQWGHRTFTGQTVNGSPVTLGADARIYDAWAVTTDGSAKVIAILDSGVYWMHPEFQGQMWVNPGEIPGNDEDDDDNGVVDDVHGAFISYDPPCWPSEQDPPDPPAPPPFGDPTEVLQHFNNPHGARVASIIGAKPGNELDLAGICWDARLMALRIPTPRSELPHRHCDFETGPLYLRALDYAVTMGAHIVNWSSAAVDDLVGLKELFDIAESEGILIVVAAGNTAGDIDDQGAPGWASLRKYPAVYGHSNMIVVAASGLDDTMAAYTNWGDISVDITAPGTHKVVLSPVVPAPPGYHYDFDVQPGSTWDSGTSFAAPYVTGVAALVWTQHPAWTPLQVIQRVLSRARLDVDSELTDGARPTVTRRLLDAWAAVCMADFNFDYNVDYFDYLDFLDAYAAEDPSADVNGDGDVDFFDYLDFIAW